MVGDTLFVLLDIEKEEEASDKVEREDGSTIIMGDRRLRCLRLLNQQLRIFAAVGDAYLLEIDEHYKHAKMLLCICESSIKKENKNKQN